MSRHSIDHGWLTDDVRWHCICGQRVRTAAWRRRQRASGWRKYVYAAIVADSLLLLLSLSLLLFVVLLCCCATGDQTPSTSPSPAASPSPVTQADAFCLGQGDVDCSSCRAAGCRWCSNSVVGGIAINGTCRASCPSSAPDSSGSCPCTDFSSLGCPGCVSRPGCGYCGERSRCLNGNAFGPSAATGSTCDIANDGWTFGGTCPLCKVHYVCLLCCCCAQHVRDVLVSLCLCVCVSLCVGLRHMLILFEGQHRLWILCHHQLVLCQQHSWNLSC